MGKKVSPTLFRLGTLRTWSSRWFADDKDYGQNLKRDVFMREYLLKKYRHALLSRVEIERSAGTVTVTLHVGRPGVIIGKGGKGVTSLQEELQKQFLKDEQTTTLRVNVQEIRPTMSDAHVVALTVSEQIEKRMPFRRVLKQVIDQVKQVEGVEGVKISISGRLNFADMSRREWLSWGKIPLHTIRADIDFAKITAPTKVGSHGIKVWIYRGEVFHRKDRERRTSRRHRGNHGNGRPSKNS